MATRQILFIIALLVLISAGVLFLAPPINYASVSVDEAVGWYESEEGDHLLLTWNASDGLHIVNFATGICQFIAPTDGQMFRWRVEHDTSSPANRIVEFRRSSDGDVQALRWQDGTGQTGILERDSTYGYGQEELNFASNSTRLSGLLMLPRGVGPHPGVVFIHGSGDSDRTNLWALSIAHELAMNGYAVLLPDKRGAGKSEGDWEEVGFEVLAQDAREGVKALTQHSGIDADRVGVLGVSQGGRIAPLAAREFSEIAFVVNISGSAVSFEDQSAHEMANTTRQAGFGEDIVREVLELNRLAGEYLRTGNWEPYGKMLDEALMSEWAPIAEGFPQTPDSPRWDWLRLVIDYDPIDHWKRVDQPALIIYGQEDEQDNVPVADSVERLHDAFGAVGKENYKIEIFEHTGHSLRDRETQQLRDDFLRALIEWLDLSVAGR